MTSTKQNKVSVSLGRSFQGSNAIEDFALCFGWLNLFTQQIINTRAGIQTKGKAS